MKPLHSHDPKDGPLLSPREEAERSAEAGKRTLERARNDPAFARQLLVDIGYFEMMADEELEAEITNGNVPDGAEDQHQGEAP